MEYDKELEATISPALREVERRNFMTRVPDNLIRHSKELKLRKRVAEQDETISLLMNAMDLLLEQ